MCWGWGVILTCWSSTSQSFQGHWASLSACWSHRWSSSDTDWLCQKGWCETRSFGAKDRQSLFFLHLPALTFPWFFYKVREVFKIRILFFKREFCLFEICAWHLLDLVPLFYPVVLRSWRKFWLLPILIRHTGSHP